MQLVLALLERALEVARTVHKLLIFCMNSVQGRWSFHSASSLPQLAAPLSGASAWNMLIIYTVGGRASV